MMVMGRGIYGSPSIFRIAPGVLGRRKPGGYGDKLTACHLIFWREVRKVKAILCGGQVCVHGSFAYLV